MATVFLEIQGGGNAILNFGNLNFRSNIRVQNQSRNIPIAFRDYRSNREENCNRNSKSKMAATAILESTLPIEPSVCGVISLSCDLCQLHVKNA